MIDGSTQKGFIVILTVSLLLLISSGIAFYLFNYSQPKKQINENRKITKLLSNEPLSTKPSTQVTDLPQFLESDIDITKIPNDGRLYLALNLSDKSTKNKINVFTKAPENSQVTYSLTRENDLDITMKVNGAQYNIKIPSGGTEGPCPMEKFGNQCGYIDEEIQTLSLVKISTLRIWKKRNGIFLLNPIWIYKDNFYINHIEIYKKQPDTVFKEQEVNMWRDILEFISFEKAI